eukprot:TRINITY_DN1221_c0_g1_i1.p1 TRINITY_DN1221_c0_g1~~TRINITY_DN1221_c0_g1_i1.p1  ORF type:complete len:210 (-),score=53.61 TRINITY_DN1221_c0_g1_i1:108-737(-)
MNIDEDEGEEVPTQVKVVILGEQFVGKTSLCRQFVSQTFEQNSEPTVRIAFQSKNINLNGEKVTLRIWDTAGQEKYRSLAPIYYKGADVAIIVYDVTNEDSFETLKYWIDQLRVNIGVDEKLCIAIAGNKSDSSEKDRKVPTQMGEEIANINGALFSETSARTGDNVNSLFIKATKIGINYRKEKDREKSQRLSITQEENVQPEKNFNC